MIEKQQFLNWLKKRNIYDSYMRSFNGNQVLSDKIFLTFDEFFDYYQTEPRKFLLRAFYWQETPEGNKYWSNMYDDWFNFCEECIEKT
jgi:hypothetical protein